VRITNMTSTVKLIVDSRFKMRVTVVTEDGSEVEGLLNGSGGDEITIDYIEKNKEIKKGNKVYVSKVGLFYVCSSNNMVNQTLG